MKKTIIFFTEEKMIIEEKSCIFCTDYKQIVSIWCNRPYLMLKTLDKKDKYIFHTIKEIICFLPDSFVVCNRSVLVNLDHFSSLEISKNQWLLYLKTGEKVPITNKYKKIVKERIRHVLSF